MQCFRSVAPATWEAGAIEYLSSGVQGQPEQHSKNPSQKASWEGVCSKSNWALSLYMNSKG
jgi:hypothetical protein